MRVRTLFVIAGILTAASLAAQQPAPARRDVPSIPLLGKSLDSSVSHVVKIAGTVATTRFGPGDPLLKLVNRIPGADSSAVFVMENEESIDRLGLDRFERGDDLRVTGQLVRRDGPPGTRPVYYLFPRSGSDIAAIGWTHAVARELRYGILISVSVVIAALLIAAIARERRRIATHVATVLRENESRYRTLVETAPVGILVHRRGRVVFVNSAFAKLFGVEEQQALGLRLIDLIHDSDRQRAVAWIRALRNRREGPVRSRERFKRVDGRIVEIEIAATPTIFRGEPAVQVVVNDVTTHAVLEEQLRHSQKMEAIGQLAAGVAHDFNNILTTIAGYSQLVLDEYDLGEDLRKDVEEIQHAGERASTLTKQLLAVSRRQLVLAEVIDLNDVITQAGHLFNRTIGAQITLDVSLATEPCLVFADRGQIEQVLMNLVLNARDAMPAGGLLQIETKFTTVADDGDSHVGFEPGDYVTLVVRDSGVGMSSETQQRIFDPFFTTKPVGDGSGLGLATMYGIITGARGHVSVTSTEGIGSEFTVYLPLLQSVAPEMRDTPRFVPTSRGNGARVLLIEDEAAVRAAARRILERNGYDVLEARNGPDALLLWHEDGPSVDCVVSDVVLPGMRGPELVHRFRADRREIPVLFVSGYTDRALGQLDLEMPNTAFLQKPFEPRQLASAVAELLRDSAVAAA